MSKSTINLKQLSRSLELSQTTVSRALNGFPEVNEKTRQRVLEAANRLNYHPSPSASSLATGRTKIIGHVFPISENMMINPHFSDFAAGACEAYASAGYEMLIRVVPENEEEPANRNFAGHNQVDGVIIHSPRVDEPRIKILQSLAHPFVVHGRCGQQQQNYSWLDVNNLRAFQRATELLIDLGHCRIALINGLETMNFAYRRRQGYEAALDARHLSIDPALVTSEDMVEPYGYRVTKRFLAMPNPPTAILCASVLPALGVVRALSELGLRPGSDISIITYDDELSFLQQGVSGNQVDIPFFTSIRSSIRKAGKRVAEILIEQINADKAEIVQELWEAELVLGSTTGKCPR